MPVTNQFFGPLVTVAGLLWAQDVLEGSRAPAAISRPMICCCLPRVMLDNAGTKFLDDVTLEEFRARVPARVVFARGAAELAAAVGELAQQSLSPARSVEGTPSRQ